MSAAIAFSVLLASVPVAEQTDWLLFGSEQNWALLDGRGALVERFTLFGGLQAIDATISPRGDLVALTARDPDVQNDLLYLWTREPPTLRRLGRERGYHAQPRFSRDGKWIVFSHNPNKGGRPGQHEPGANSQLYRVRPDGTRMDGRDPIP